MADYTLTAKLTADTKGLQKGFRTAQEALSNLQSKTATIGTKLQSLGKNISKFGDTLTKRITLPAVGAATALASITLVKGFNRLVGIDTARAKLEALGHDAKSVENIMKSALDSVRGTAYGLDEAATTAASAVAAGVKPGKDLTRYLSLAADAAAIAGTSMAEMGSIFNKVQTAQRAYTGELNMLADRGLPIFQWLADEAGVTAEAIRDMASNGKISAEMFLSAIEKNIGGASKIIGEKSFSAAVANIGADIARIGAAFLDAGGQAGGFFSTVKPLLTEFRGFLAQIEEKAADWGVAFGNAFVSFIDKLRQLKASFDALSPTMQNLILKGSAIGAALIVGLGPALSIGGRVIALFGTLTTIFATLLSPIGLVVAAIVGFGIAFGTAMAKSEEFRQKIFGAFEQIKQAVSNVISTIQPILGNLFNAGIEAVNNFADTIGDRLLTAFEVIASVASTVVGVINQFVSSAIEGFRSAGGEVNSLTALFFGLNPVIKLAISAFSALGPQIATGFAEIASNVMPLLTTLGQALGQLAAAVLPLILNVISTLIPIVVQLGTAFMQIAMTVLPVVLNLFTQIVPVVMLLVQVIADLVTQILPLASVLIDAILPVFMMLVDVIMNIVTAVAPALIAVISAVIAIFEAVIPVVVTILDVVLNVMANIISAIMPIIAIVAGIISSIIAIIAPIVTYIANIIAAIFKVITPIIKFTTNTFNTVFDIISSVFRKANQFISKTITTISGVISKISSIVSQVFNKVWSIVSNIMGKVSSKISSVFTAIRNSWEGLRTFVSNVFSGIRNAVQKLVNQVKGFVNKVIGGINAAIGLINKIPGVNISKIPQLQRGTDNWEGGFARINEGGRGELVMLPSGTQVIPHDVSMKYAREIGRRHAMQQVVVTDNDSELVAKAVKSLEDTLSRLQLVMNERVVAEILEKPITEIQQRKGNVLHAFRG